MEAKQKQCCVVDCHSSAHRQEDRGVTFHKFPKGSTDLREQWSRATKHCPDLADKQYVCSRHFYKADFETFRDSKYVLRAGAVPSIFSWTVKSITKNMEEVKPTLTEEVSASAIDNKGLVKDDSDCEKFETPTNVKAGDNIADPENETRELASTSGLPSERKSITVIHMIHRTDTPEYDETISLHKEADNISRGLLPNTDTRKDKKSKTNQTSLKKSEINTGDQDETDSAFSVGSHVEAKDFCEIWHSARIMEVDSDEMEVLVHYENYSQKHDEWISVSSPRIRSINSNLTASPSGLLSEIKIPMEYKVGERCYARWSDNRRFPATVRSVLGNGKYEIIFDDGICRICQWYCLSKMKSSKKSTSTASQENVASTPPPPKIPVQPLPLPSAPATPAPFHRHLFDPRLDYLGPKSERREMKKKLDVKTLFNIGKRTITKPVKRKKPDPVDEAPRPKKRRGRNKKKKERSIKVEDITEDVPLASLGSPKSEIFIMKDDIKTVIKQDIKEESEYATSKDLDEMKFNESDDKPITEPIVEYPISNEIKEDIKPTIDEPSPNKSEFFVLQKEDDNPCKLEVPEGTLPMPKKTRRKSSHKIDKKSSTSTQSAVAKNDANEVVQNENADNMADPLTVETSTGDEVKIENVNAIDSTKKENETVGSVISSVVNVEVTEDNKVIEVKEDNIYCPDPTTDASISDSNYTANDPLEVIHETYGMDIGEGLKLIAEAVESFEAEQALKNEAKVVAPEVVAVSSISEAKEEEVPAEYEAMPAEGEWCCRWVDGEPQGLVCDLLETESPSRVDKGRYMLPRKSVLVEDKRLPANWKKMMVRRSCGSSAGKWDVVLVDPQNRRLRDKGEMRNYLSVNNSEELKQYEHILMDFSVQRKLARRLGWDRTTPEGSRTAHPILIPLLTPTVISPKHKTKASLKLKKKARTPGSEGPPAKKKKLHTPPVTTLYADAVATPTVEQMVLTPPSTSVPTTSGANDPFYPMVPLEEGFVYVGSLKVQIIENLFRCPAIGCFKNFRKDNLLRMHIKHYHREMKKLLGSTPKVSDLAYARTAIPENTVIPKLKCEGENKIQKPKHSPKTLTEKVDKKETGAEQLYVDTTSEAPVTNETADKLLSLQDSPKLRIALENLTPIKRAKVLYPVKKFEIKSEQASPRLDSSSSRSDTPDLKPLKEDMEAFVKIQKLPEYPESKVQMQLPIEHLDFEAAISTHTVTKPAFWKRKQKIVKKPKIEGIKPLKLKKRKSSGPKWTPVASDAVETWEVSDPETRSSYGLDSLTPESKPGERKPDVSALLLPDTINATSIVNRDPDFMVSESGEKIKIVHMKREEIINCHCGFGEEDGLMIQCDLCLCWQHAICYNYDTNTVPDKYICSICTNPRRGRASRRFLHDQSWLYEGALPGGAPDAALRRAHELTANLLRLSNVLNTLRLKYQVATKKDHPKLYLWAKDWENAAHIDSIGHERVVTEHLNHVDLNDMFREIGKENLPLKPSEDMGEDHKSYDSQKDDGQLGSQVLLANLLSSPGGPSLDLPISTSELERLAKSVEESEVGGVRGGGPEPEAPIESGACRKHLLRHIQRCQALIDSRLDSIEAQVAELESQDPRFEDDETVEYFPRTKQTIQMLHRDLDTLHELGIIT